MPEDTKIRLRNARLAAERAARKKRAAKTRQVGPKMVVRQEEDRSARLPTGRVIDAETQQVRSQTKKPPRLVGPKQTAPVKLDKVGRARVAEAIRRERSHAAARAKAQAIRKASKRSFGQNLGEIAGITVRQPAKSAKSFVRTVERGDLKDILPSLREGVEKAPETLFTETSKRVRGAVREKGLKGLLDPGLYTRLPEDYVQGFLLPPSTTNILFHGETGHLLAGGLGAMTAFGPLRGTAAARSALKTGLKTGSLRAAASAARQTYRESTPLLSGAKGAYSATTKGRNRILRLNDMTIDVPAAGSRTGRLLGRAADDAKTQAQAGAIAREAGKAVHRRLLTRYRTLTKGVPGLRRDLAKLNDEESYALHLLADQTPVDVRVAQQGKWYMDALQAEDNVAVADHSLHIDLATKAGKFVTTTPEGQVVLAPDAPEPLVRAWEAIQNVQSGREDILEALRVLTPETMKARAYAMGRIYRGAAFKENEAAFREALNRNPNRQAFEQAVREQLGGDEEAVRRTMHLLDSVVRSKFMDLAHKPGEYERAVLDFYNKIEEPQLWANDLLSAEADFTKQMQFGDAPNEVLFDELKNGPSDETKRAYLNAARRLIREFGPEALPENHQTATRLGTLMLGLRERAFEAEAFRRWYEESARAILQETHGNPEEAIKLAKLFAIYSPRAKVYDESTWNNTARALGAWREAKSGQPISDNWSLSKNRVSPKTGEPLPDWQTIAAQRVIDGGPDWKGLKTNSFYSNFLKHIDPALHDELFGPEGRVTIDTWMRRAFEYLKKPPKTKKGKAIEPEAEQMALLGVKPMRKKGKMQEPITPEMYSFMSKVTRMIAQEFGWAPEEAQAAIWISIKAEIEGTPLDQAGVSFSDALERTNQAIEAKRNILRLPEGPEGQGDLFSNLPRQAPSEATYERQLNDWVKRQRGGKSKSAATESEIQDARKFFDRNPDAPQAEYFNRMWELSGRDAEVAIPFDAVSAPSLTPEEAYAEFERVMARDDFLDLNAQPRPGEMTPREQRKFLQRRVAKQDRRQKESGWREFDRRIQERRKGDQNLLFDEVSASRFDDAARSAIDNGGFTVRPDGSPGPDSGYMVSYGGHERKMGAASAEEIAKYADEMAPFIRKYEGYGIPVYIGGWTDDAGMMTLDLSRNFPNEETALEFALRNHQDAIWDIKGTQSIDTGLDPAEAAAGRAAMAEAANLEAIPTAPEVDETPGVTDMTQFERAVADEGIEPSDMTQFEAALPPETLLFHTEDLAKLSDEEYQYLVDNYVAHGTDPESAKSILQARRIIAGYGGHEVGYGMAWTSENPRLAARYADAKTYDRTGQERGVVILIPRSAVEGQPGVVVSESVYGQSRYLGGKVFQSPRDILFDRFVDGFTRSILGAAQFTEGPLGTTFRMHLAGKAGETTIVHELAHMIRRMILTPQQEKMIAKWAGAKADGKGGYTWTREAEEKFANGMMQVIMQRKGPPGMRSTFRQVAKTLRKDFYHRDLPDVDPHVADIMENLFGYGKLKGGRLVGAEDWVVNSNFTPVYLGYKQGHPLPLNMTPVARAAGAYAKVSSEMGTFFGGGRARAIGAGPVDQKTRHQLTGALVESARVTASADAAVEDAIVAARLMVAHEARTQYLLPASTELPSSPYDIPVVVDPSTRTSSSAMRRIYEDITALGDEGKLDANQVKALEDITHKHISNDLFPEEIDGKSFAVVAQEAFENSTPVTNIRWLPRDFVEHTGLLHRPRVPLADRIGPGWGKRVYTAAAFTYDTVSTVAKAVLTVWNPAYPFMNMVGTTMMNAFHQGIFAPLNLWKAADMSMHMADANKILVDNIMGHGFAENVGFHGPFNFGIDRLAAFESLAIDMFQRRAAFLHEARKAGYTGESLDTLLDNAADPQASLVLDQIRARAVRKIGDFESLSPVERDVAGRLILFYPWFKVGTMYTVHLAIDQPALTAALILMYEHAQVAAERELGKRPRYASQTIPISTQSIGLNIPYTGLSVGLEDVIGEHTMRDGVGNPFVISLRQAFAQTTPVDLAEAIKKILTGDDRESLINWLTPLPSAVIQASMGKDVFYNKDIPKGPKSVLDLLFGRAPVWKYSKDLQGEFTKTNEELDKENKSKVYPRRLGAKITRFGAGSLAPTPYNPAQGEQAAAWDSGDGSGRAISLRNKAREFGQEVPEEVLQQAKWSAVLEDMTGSPQEKAKKYLDLYNKVFPENATTVEIDSDEIARAVMSTIREQMTSLYRAYNSALKEAEGSR